LLSENVNNENENECRFIGASQKYSPGGGWFYPLGDGRAGKGMAVVNNYVRFPGRELKENFQKTVRELDPFSLYLKNARNIRFKTGIIPIGHIDKCTYNCTPVIGDATGNVTPWMCMGVELVLTDGAMAAEVVKNALDKNDIPGRIN
jgi:flavin-dependent dehydrogenase